MRHVRVVSKSTRLAPQSGEWISFNPNYDQDRFDLRLHAARLNRSLRYQDARDAWKAYNLISNAPGALLSTKSILQMAHAISRSKVHSATKMEMLRSCLGDLGYKRKIYQPFDRSKTSQLVSIISYHEWMSILSNADRSKCNWWKVYEPFLNYHGYEALLRLLKPEDAWKGVLSSLVSRFGDNSFTRFLYLKYHNIFRQQTDLIPWIHKLLVSQNELTPRERLEIVRAIHHYPGQHFIVNDQKLTRTDLVTMILRKSSIDSEEKTFWMAAFTQFIRDGQVEMAQYVLEKAPLPSHIRQNDLNEQISAQKGADSHSITSERALREYCVSLDVRQALSLFRRMRDKGHVPSRYHCSLLLALMARSSSGEFLKVFQAFSQSYPVDVHILLLLYEALRTSGSSEKSIIALRFIKETIGFEKYEEMLQGTECKRLD